MGTDTNRPPMTRETAERRLISFTPQDIDDHVRLLRESNGTLSLYTADLLEAAGEALVSARADGYAAGREDAAKLLRKNMKKQSAGRCCDNCGCSAAHDTARQLEAEARTA